jgi:hypothetical protein
MLFCLVGASSICLPWVSSVQIFVENRPADLADVVKAKGIYGRTLYGFEMWHGYVVAAGFLGLLLFLVAIGPIQPAPWWRSAVLFLGSAAIIAVSLMGRHYKYAAVYDQGQPNVMVSDPTWTLGSWGPVGAAVLVMGSAAFEIRCKLAAHCRAKDRSALE